MTSNDAPSRTEAADALREYAAAAAAGDDAAFEAIHRRLERGLLRFFQERLRGSDEAAEELAQKAWIQVWRALRQGRYEPQRAAVSTFVYAVAYHVWLQHCRESGGGGATLDAGLLADLGAGAASSPDAEVQLAELLVALEGCVSADGTPQSLSEDERRIVLGLAAGDTERQLAERYRCSASTIHARKTAAYEKLRRCLKKKGYAGDSSERGARPGEQ